MQHHIRNTAIAAVALGAMALTGCTASGDSGPSDDVYTVALSNSFLGNDWRQNMENVAEYVVANLPIFQDKIELQIVNTENSPQAQSASIDGLVQKGVDAIIVDAASPTALNTSIQRACDAGIVVVAFDNNVTADCAYNVSWDFKAPAAAAADWLAQQIGGEGNLVVDTGLAGVQVSADILDGMESTLADYPGIEVVAQYAGEFASGPSAQAFASIVATQPKIDAVFTQGYCDVVIEALQQANRPLVPMYCQGFNGNFVACTTVEGASCIANPSSPGISAIALRVALDVLEGKSVDKNTVIGLPLYATDTTVDIGVDYGDMASIARDDLPSGLTLPAVPPGFGVDDVPAEAMLK